MGEKLKPCPFCGETASIERYGNHRVSTIYQCDHCSCRLETGEVWDHGKVWNHRTDPEKSPPDPELLECLKDARRLLTDQDAIDLVHIDEVIAKSEGGHA